MKKKSGNAVFFFVAFIILLFHHSPSTTIGDVAITDLKKINTINYGVKKADSLKPDIYFGNIPLYFTHNKGQVNKKALFYAKTPGYTLWITKKGLVFDSIKIESKTNSKLSILNSKLKTRNKSNSKFKIQNSALVNRDISRLIFIGANRDLKIEPLKVQKLKVNYFKGNDKTKWKGNIPTSGAVLYKNIYKNIDLKVYGIGKQIEYDWIVKPGGDPSDIRFEYKNIKKISINKEGDLDIKTQFGTLFHKKPISFQLQPTAFSDGTQVKSKRTKIEVEFKKDKNNTFGFKIGEYDKNKTLIIDPVVLAYSTCLGGSKSDSGRCIAVDKNGSAYVTGYTRSIDFPIFNQFQEDTGFPWDAFISKLSPSGNSLVYSTYLGGSSEDVGYSIVVDQSGSAYVTGHTSSTDFPTLNPYQGDMGEGSDAFVTKLSPSGNSLIYSTYLGGNDNESGKGIAVHSSGSAYVTGYTWSTNYPIKNQYQVTLQGYNDSFITRLSPSGNSLVYSTYLGGNGWDGGTGIEVDQSGSAYVTGYTSSTDFPTLNPYQGDRGGGSDAFVTKLSPTGNSLIYSTYLGGEYNDYGEGVAIDSSDSAYITGRTNSLDFPTFNPYQKSHQGDDDAFVTKLSPSGDSLVYSTYLGGSSRDRGFGIAIDRSGSAYITGETRSIDFPTLNQYQGYPGNLVAFITRLSTSGNSLIYSTYFGGGKSNDSGSSIAVDLSRSVYITGYTSSSDFPVLNEFKKNQSEGDAFVTKLSPNQVFFKVIVSVSGEGGKVDKLLHKAIEGKNVVINIFPDEGFEIDKIIDNGLEMPVSNPYIIYKIDTDHSVEITFKKLLYPPTLELTGIRKTETSWIIKRDYTELKISITEHISPMIVSSYILYKSISGIWVEAQRYHTQGDHSFIDKFFKPGESVSYKLTAMAPDGAIVAETNILTL